MADGNSGNAIGHSRYLAAEWSRADDETRTMLTHDVDERSRMRDAIAAVRRHAQPLEEGPRAASPIPALVGDARFALLGEASHGTHDFYAMRAEITKTLILEKGFTAVAVEGDWPDALRVNRYVRGVSADRDANAALAGFERFPGWMWRNTVVLDFVRWLRDYNDAQPDAAKVGFYGMDLYSLQTSITAVLAHLDRVDPAAAARARHRYACFDHFGEDTQAYGYAAAFGMSRTCEDEVVAQLVDMTRRAGDAAGRDADSDEHFFAAQNARLVKNAEEYYRTMFKGRVSSWNLRDRHMIDTLRALDAHLARGRQPPRIAVWAHNSHLGDARATDMGRAGEWNVGQLAREHYARDAVLVGFTTHHGTVTAASDWGGAAELKRVRPGLAGSCEALFHAAELARFALVLRGNGKLAPLDLPLLQRAIGVIYLPESERASHYFETRLTRQFDAIIHLDESRALEPLEPGPAWAHGEVPETFPSGV
jgi:erythromycin esterase-like protein